MWRSPDPRFDVASAISRGGREYQEDAVVTDFPVGSDSGFIVLADGMGGHAAGDVASKIVLTEVYSELKFQSPNFLDFEAEIPDYLHAAADAANASVRGHVSNNPETHGMGATLVSIVLVEDRLFWMSIGDSPLYLFRGGKMSQLNEDHSMAPQIDFMIKSGLMDPEVGKNHPDRNCLTSVILGEKVAKVDCPDKPIDMQEGDIIIVSSDGLQYLEDRQIERIVVKNRRKSSAEISRLLLAAIDSLDDPDQDNVSFSIVKVNHIERYKRLARAPKSRNSLGSANGTKAVPYSDVVNLPDFQEPPTRLVAGSKK
ncbi:serine/threonine-protein phosphatase [Actibacterium sp. 188UL27-1]|nr:protein phosphatase 2C domain-containing protein [Actibacterium sp. 188UL27-1]MBM7067977.1 serine/threonine-protein phosphatase [Actibacterium sp. 188UL27-1]